jgi:hypothetical protein
VRAAWVIAAFASAIVACSSHPAVPFGPTSVPCGYRVVKTERWAVAVPLYWQGEPMHRRLASRGVTMLLGIDGGAASVVLASRRWSGNAKALTNLVLTSSKEKRYEIVEQRPLPNAGEDAVLVEQRRWDPDRKTQWHEWWALTVAGHEGFALMCRVDENDLKTLGQVCTAVAESFVVAR